MRGGVSHPTANGLFANLHTLDGGVVPGREGQDSGGWLQRRVDSHMGRDLWRARHQQADVAGPQGGDYMRVPRGRAHCHGLAGWLRARMGYVSECVGYWVGLLCSALGGNAA